MMLGLVGFGLSAMEILVLVLVVLLLFGPSKLPQLGEGIGKMLRGFKKEMKELEEDRAVDRAEKAEKAQSAKAPREDAEIDVTPKDDEARKTG